MTLAWMKQIQKAFSAFALAGACASVLVVSRAAAIPQAAQATQSVPAGTCVSAGAEAHVFSGSSTAVAVFEAWFAGKDFVQPTIETLDLRVLRVNDAEEAFGGDTVYKDADGTFHVAKSGC